MKKYETVEEITKAFIKMGWTSPTFRETTESEKHAIFGETATREKLYTMTATGNIYTATGKIYYYNLKGAKV